MPKLKVLSGKEVVKIFSKLDQKIEELNSRIVELRKATDNISAELKNVKAIKDLSDTTSRHEGIIEVIHESAENRTSDREFGCIWIDRDGFCNKWTFLKRNGWNMRQKEHEGEVFYQLNVKEQPLVFMACPQFEKRGISLTKT